MHIRTKECHRIGFGLFEVNLSTFELYKRGVSIHIQDQPFRILALLLERPGEVVTREELRRKIWPADTFVDFNDGLNTAIKKLRCALGDSPDNPTFIETIPRHGYRFIAPQQTIGPVPHLQQPSKADGRDPHLGSSKRAGLDEEPQDPNHARES